MNDDQSQPTGTEADPAEPKAPTPEEEELRRQMEEEIRKVRMEDLILQSAVSLLNLAARRIGREDERDLEQARIGIDAAEAMSGYAPEEARPQIAQAVSELKLAYAKEAGGGSDEGKEGASPGEAEEPSKPHSQADSGLWTPGGDKA
ncbi:MAG: hypothetical protein ACKOPI_02840 [bacterium]